MIFAIFRLLSLLPLPVLHGLGVVLGWLIYLAPGRHRARLKNNLAQSGPFEAHGGGMMLVGRFFEKSTLLRVAHAYEAEGIYTIGRSDR